MIQCCMDITKIDSKHTLFLMSLRWNEWLNIYDMLVLLRST